MHTRVITIARQIGAAGEDVALDVAKKLGFRYIDYQVIQDAAQGAGVSPETVSEAEHTPSLLTRVLESLARSPGVPTVTWADPVPVSTHPLYTSADYRELVGEVIRDVADKGDCVIIGHGAHRFLRSRGDTLRVFITGSAAHRLRRVTSHMAADENTAQKALEGSDSERSDYFKRFFDIDWRDASNYDITLSTDTLSPEGVAEIISLAARLR